MCQWSMLLFDTSRHKMRRLYSSIPLWMQNPYGNHYMRHNVRTFRDISLPRWSMTLGSLIPSELICGISLIAESATLQLVVSLWLFNIDQNLNTKCASQTMTAKSMITLDTGVITANSKHLCPCRHHFRLPERNKEYAAIAKINKLFLYT
jgi:hypothetical protein